MRVFKASEKPVLAEQAVTESELLRSLTRSGASVVCIGAYGKPEYDPSPLWLAHETESRVTLVDGQDLTLLAAFRKAEARLRERGLTIPKQVPRAIADLEAHERQYKATPLGTKYGTGGLVTYGRRVRELAALGRIRPVRIRLVPALAWRTRIKPESADLVFDRGSWRYIHGQTPDALEKTLEHYYRLVKPEGSFVLLTRIKTPLRAGGADGVREGFYGGVNVLKIVEEKFGGKAKIKVQSLASTHDEPYIIKGARYHAVEGFDTAIIVTKPKKPWIVKQITSLTRRLKKK